VGVGRHVIIKCLDAILHPHVLPLLLCVLHCMCHSVAGHLGSASVCYVVHWNKATCGFALHARSEHARQRITVRMLLIRRFATQLCCIAAVPDCSCAVA
jgi:hypothetical protein